MMTRGTQSIGLGSNGKGSKDRTTDKTAYDQNRAEIVFPGVTGGAQTSRGFRKVYGVKQPPYNIEELENTPVTGINLLPNPYKNIEKYLTPAAKSGMRPAGEPPCDCQIYETCARCRAWPGGSDAVGANVAPGPEPLRDRIHVQDSNFTAGDTLDM